MKFPIGIQSFERIIQEGYIYVDKTDIIYDLTQTIIQDVRNCFTVLP